MTIIDWALQERLSRDQRRHLVLLFAMLALRDPVSTCAEVIALMQQSHRKVSFQRRIITETVRRFLEELPPSRLPGMVGAMELLERAALVGVRFPKSLIMLSKVMFTLDGILDDIGGSGSGTGLHHCASSYAALAQRAEVFQFAPAGNRLGDTSVQCFALLQSPLDAL